MAVNPVFPSCRPLVADTSVPLILFTLIIMSLPPRNRGLFMACFMLCLPLAQGQPQPGTFVQDEIPDVIAPGTSLLLVKDGFQGNTEGPIATPDGGLYFSDIEGSRIYRLDASGRITIWREHTNRTNGLYFLNGRLLCAEGNGPRIISTPRRSVFPRIEDRSADTLEVARIASNDGQIVGQRGRGYQRINRWQRPPGARSLSHKRRPPRGDPGIIRAENHASRSWTSHCSSCARLLPSASSSIPF